MLAPASCVFILESSAVTGRWSPATPKRHHHARATLETSTSGAGVNTGSIHSRGEPWRRSSSGASGELHSAIALVQVQSAIAIALAA